MRLMRTIFISLIAVTFACSSAHAAFDRKIKNSQNDSTAGFLCGDKLISGTNITVVEGNDGGDETCTINASVSGSGVNLDLTDDDVNESTGINEIAIINDTNGIVDEPSADKMRIDMSKDWPKADDADEVTCTACVADSELATDFISETELDSEAELETQIIGVSNFYSDNDVVPFEDGGTGLSSAADDTTLVSNGSAWQAKTIPDCDSVTDKLAYTASTNEYSCITDNNASGTGYATIEDEGTPLTQRTVLNFIGSAVTCADDAGGTTDCTISSGGQVPVDLGNNSVDDITGLSRINTANDTNNVVSNNTGSEILIDMGQNWPTSDAATALSANGANCSAGNYPLGVDASGAVEGCTPDDDVPEVGDFDAFVGGNHTTYDAGADQLNLDAEVVNHIHTINIFDPTTSDTNKIQDKFPSAITISRISCSTDTGTATIQFDERAEGTPNTSGTDVMTSTLVCDNDSQATTSFTNAGIAADAPYNLQITATASTPTIVRIHTEYTIDDV